MSNQIAKQRNSKAKDIRQGVTAQPEKIPAKKGKGKPFKVIGTYGIKGKLFYFENYCFGVYNRIQDAEKAFARTLKKNYVFDLRIEGPDT